MCLSAQKLLMADELRAMALSWSLKSPTERIYRLTCTELLAADHVCMSCWHFSRGSECSLRCKQPERLLAAGFRAPLCSEHENEASAAVVSEDEVAVARLVATVHARWQYSEVDNLQQQQTVRIAPCWLQRQKTIR